MNAPMAMVADASATATPATTSAGPRTAIVLVSDRAHVVPTIGVALAARRRTADPTVQVVRLPSSRWPAFARPFRPARGG